MNITILTLYFDNYQPLADIVLPNLREYCRKHDYHFYHYQEKNRDGVSYGFSKLELLLLVLYENKHDYIFVTDLDIFITNPEIKIESFIDDQHDFFITEDVNGINAGSFIIRNTEWSKRWIEFILSQREGFANEQLVMQKFMWLKKWRTKIKVLDHPSINSYPYPEYLSEWKQFAGDAEYPTHEEGNWQEGDFILHLPALSLERRIEIFSELKKES